MILNLIKKILPESWFIKYGYKATDMKMKCRGFQYVIGERHYHEGKVQPGVSGFHFCKNKKDIARFRGDYRYRVFLCRIDGTVVNDKNHPQSATNTITLLKEVSK